LGLDGAIGFEGVDFCVHWNSYLTTDDMVNANTGQFDPRHMYGTTNQGKKEKKENKTFSG
jgi:alpha-1,3-glucan synthase